MTDPAMHRKLKIEIVVDAAAIDAMTALIERNGAKGYTVVPDVSGKGIRGVRTGHDPFSDAPNAMIIVVASHAVGERIMREALALLESYAGVVYSSEVNVLRDEHF